MGRRNTSSGLYSQEFQRLNLFAQTDSNKTLPYLGLIDYSPIDRFTLRCTVGSKD